jgi:transcriptional regulator with XRE-family HTH domain
MGHGGKPKKVTRGSRIRNARRALRLTLAQVASKCDASIGHLSLIERDEKTPGRELLFRLASALNVSPEWIETGQESRIDQAETARRSLWPECIYLLANQLVFRPGGALRQDGDNMGSHTPGSYLDELMREVEPIESALRGAWNARHWCEFKLWSDREEGIRIGEAIKASSKLSELVRKLVVPHRPGNEVWLEYIDPALPRPRLLPRALSKGQHAHSYGSISSTALTAAECFDFDVLACFRMYSDLRFGLFRPEAPWYTERPFNGAFVEAAFPTLFMTAAKAWSDRRLAGWFGYLGLPLDVFAPLVRLARQYESAELFSASAKLLLDRASIADRDAFLGMCADIYGQPDWYSGPFVVSPLVDWLPRARGN